MKTLHRHALPTVLATLAIATTGTLAAKNNTPAPPPLNEGGQQLKAHYEEQLAALKADLTKALPAVNGGGQAAYLKAREAEAAATEALKAAQALQGEVGKGQALVAHAKGKWIGGAEKGIATAKEKIKKATTPAEREAAEKELANWEKNKQDGLDALKERQAQLDKALRDQPKVERAVKAAEKALADAKADTVKALQNLGLASVLSSNTLDAKLAGYVAMMEATPAGLAAFAQQGEAHKELIDVMFNDGDLLVQMAVADGANGGNYGRAMEIYRDIRKAGAKANEGHFQRLALAVALEHAVPVGQRNADAASDAPATVDPVQRYLAYEKAFLAGELDPAFKNLTTWDYRMVVDGEEPNEIAAWGREMLRNYRPDQVTKSDYRWRYVELVRSDIRYGSQDNQFDQPELHFFQNILKNGGICGRRAFIGRFILRAFGIPTTARPQSGHAALVHWTPDGWVPCLGAGWGSGWTKTRYDRDLDFLATTQARATGDAFMQVKRAQWIGDLMGEPRVFGFLAKQAPGFWYGVSLYTQAAIIEAAKAKTLDAVGQDIAEANETKETIEISKVTLSDEDRKIHVDANGAIVIPAAATAKPTSSTGKILFMDSVLGGKQLHYGRNGNPQEFEYTFDAPAAGKYALTSKVVTPSWQQILVATANDAGPVEIPLPHTVGLWDTTAPVTVELKRGRNVLRFSHKSDGQAKGFSIHSFTLTPQ